MPQTARSSFQGRTQNLLRDYGEMLLAVHGKTRQASLEVMLSEQAAMSLGVYWEAFIHDLFVAYVTRNPTNCIFNFKERMDKNIADKSAIPARWVTIQIPSVLSPRQAERLI